jgi:hypothetical protein
MGNILTGFMVLLILLGVSSPIIVVGVVYYLKKRLEHKQIMAAIEKGTPLSEIMPTKTKPAGPAWIRYASAGIALIIIGLGFTLFNPRHTNEFGILIFVVLGGIGVAMLVRGLLHRKYYLKNQNSLENNSTKKEKSA